MCILCMYKKMFYVFFLVQQQNFKLKVRKEPYEKTNFIKKQ